jgi:hypothetical protein
MRAILKLRGTSVKRNRQRAERLPTGSYEPALASNAAMRVIKSTIMSVILDFLVVRFSRPARAPDRTRTSKVTSRGLFLLRLLLQRLRDEHPLQRYQPFIPGVKVLIVVEDEVNQLVAVNKAEVTLAAGFAFCLRRKCT